jgi:pyruvate kinase
VNHGTPSLELSLRVALMMEIMATVSFKTFDEAKVRAMLQAGAHVLRYNIAHGTTEEILSRLQVALFVLTEHPGKLLVDIPGSKPRVGEIPGGSMFVERGSRYLIVFGTDGLAVNVISVPGESMPVDLLPKDVVLIGDGEIAFEIEAVDGSRLVTVALTEGRFRQGESLCFYNKPNLVPQAPALSEPTLAILNCIRPQLIALSFVNRPEDVHRARETISSISDYRPELMSKIETSVALNNLDEIIEASDSIMVGRGDLALFSPYEDLYKNQMLCIRQSQARGRACWVGTQLLDSAMTDFVPSRSNLCDVAALAALGAHGLLLSRETGFADDPARVIRMARRIVDGMRS